MRHMPDVTHTVVPGGSTWFETKVPPPVFLAAALVAQRSLPRGRRAPLPVRGIAAGVAAASVTLAGASASAFRRRSTTVHPLHPEHASALVTDGVNSVTRNPMYLGMAGLLAAHALARGGLRTWLPLVGFVAVVDRCQIAPEERALRARFGEEYAAYERSVPRWL